jgi:ribonuclease J
VLKIIPLGGLGEVGKNMMVLETDNDIIIIDAGLMFPEDELLGIDLILPDFSYAIKNKRKVRALFLTHGHEDHTGAISFFLKQVNVPVYGTPLTLGLARNKLTEHKMLGKVKLKTIEPNRSVKVGDFKVSFIRVSHSVPDGVGLAIETPEGTILHTGDFKLDQTPVDGRMTEMDKFVSYGKKGVLALLSDSTNAEIPGYTKTETTVGEALDAAVKRAKQRVVIACFSSHVHRIQQAINVACGNGRRVAIAGRSMKASVDIASELGYLKIPPGCLIGLHEVKDFPPEEIAILATGSQGEPMAVLARLASHDMKHIDLVPGDTVIISASPVPGNEKSVARTIDQLFRIGVNVVYEKSAGVHVSGHAAQEELRLILNIVNPKYFIPIHGEYRQLKHHADLAISVGLPPENVLLAENGDVIKFKKGKGKIDGSVSAGAMFVDGLGIGDIGDVVLRDRLRLSRDGVFIVVVGIAGKKGEIVSGPDVVSRGFVYPMDNGDLIEQAKENVLNALNEAIADEISDEGILKMHVRESLSRFLYKQTKRRPMVMPIIIEV